jgi:hypothetical protein
VPVMSGSLCCLFGLAAVRGWHDSIWLLMRGAPRRRRCSSFRDCRLTGQFPACRSYRKIIVAHSLASSLPKVDLIMVPHHGSNASSTADLLAQASPQIALVSSASSGRFDFPHKAVVDRHQKIGANLLVTGDSGSITALFDQSGNISLTKSRDSAPWWLAELR